MLHNDRWSNTGDTLRDHTKVGGSDISQERKSTNLGFQVSGLDENGLESLENIGDQAGWQYWEASNTRPFGSWSFSVPVIHKSGKLYPIKANNLGVDANYIAKDLVETSTPNNFAVVRNATGAEVAQDQIGLVVQCLNQDSHELIFISTGAATITLARIAWNYSFQTDFSEGEIVSYDEETQNYIGTGELVWIDWKESTTVQFETAGNLTIFEISLKQAEHDRGGDIRSLYRAVLCRIDQGMRITHTETRDRVNYVTDITDDSAPTKEPGMPFILGNALQVKFLSWELAVGGRPWVSPIGSTISTTIGEVEKPNLAIARLALDWDLSTSENYSFLEVMETGRGQPFYFQPINPQMLDKSLNTYEFAENETTYAIYKRVIEE